LFFFFLSWLTPVLISFTPLQLDLELDMLFDGPLLLAEMSIVRASCDCEGEYNLPARDIFLCEIEK
jgi:hypothetical protein